MYQSFVDNNLDCLYIRMYTRDTAAAQGQSAAALQGSRVLVEHAVHHEIVYENDSTLAKYMRPGLKSTAAMGRAKSAKNVRDSKSPATPVS